MSSNESGDKFDMENMQENFNKQQEKITALKELVRKSEAAHGTTSSIAQEKVKNIAQRLTHLKSKARSSRQHHVLAERSFSSDVRDVSITEESDLSSSSLSGHSLIASEHNRRESGTMTPLSSIKARSETPGSEKVQLLWQQMQQNKIKMAEREHNKRELEELVTQLKVKMDITQQSLERSSELGRSMGDLSNLGASISGDGKFRSATDLSFTPLNLDKERIKFLDNRVRLLEKQIEENEETRRRQNLADPDERVKKLESKILDLEESLKEKECIIEARTKAVSLMTENLSAKGKSTVDALEDTRQEMFKMQASFLETEDTLRSEIQQLRNELESKNNKIANLEEVNDILETARFELTIKSSELESKLENVQYYATKISELNKLNESLQNRISDLENQKSQFIDAAENFEENDNSKFEVNLAENLEKGYQEQIAALQNKLAELQKENDDLKKLAQENQTVENVVSDEKILEQIQQLENTIKNQNELMQGHSHKIKELEEQLTEKTTEYNVLNANFSVLQEKMKATMPKSFFSKSTDNETEAEVGKMKSQLDEANKSMIKMKLKNKQLQKQVDLFKNSSDLHSELLKLTEENQFLQQTITELEVEKGQLQLKLLSGETGGTSVNTELENKIQILETTCKNQTSAIQLLEEQKLDMTENLQSTKHELEVLKDQVGEIDRDETARVVCQIESIKLEEKLVTYEKNIEDLSSTLEKYKIKNNELTETLTNLQLEKEALNKKMEHYVAENMELLDKVEKLSKSSSSAESIEIVERLTQQEKLELEAFNKGEHVEETTDNNQEHPKDLVEIPHPQETEDVDNSVIGEELSESLVKLREESSELMEKIELFTTERREVLEKMETITNENQGYMGRISELEEENKRLVENIDQLRNEKGDLVKRVNSLEEEKVDMLTNVGELNRNREEILEELNSIKKEKISISENVSIEPSSLVIPEDFIRNCDKNMNQLSTELENFKKATDKGSRLAASKKLAKEAHNFCQSFKELKLKLGNLSENTNTEFNIGQDVNQVHSKYLELKTIADNLKKDLISAETTIMTKDSDIENLKMNIEKLRRTSSEKEERLKEEIHGLSKLRRELESRLNTAQAEIEELRRLVESLRTQANNENLFKDNMISQYEHEINQLKDEIELLKKISTKSIQEYKEQLDGEKANLESILAENRNLISQLTNDIENNQMTIDVLNSQITELNRTMEENTNKLLDKEDEISYLQDLVDTNKIHMNMIMRESNENKRVIENLLMDLHSQTSKIQELELLEGVKEKNKMLETRVKELEIVNQAAEKRNKEQMDKLKKFAANLKKKATHCTELEKKIAELEGPEHQKQLNVAVPDNSELQKEIEERKQLQIVYEEKINAILEEKKTVLAEVEEMKTRLQNKEIELQLSIQQNQSYTSKVEEFLSQLTHCQSMVQALNSEIEIKTQNIKDLENQLSATNKNLSEKNEKMKTISEELNAKNIKFEKCRAVIKDKNSIIQRLTSEKEQLSQKILSFEQNSSLEIMNTNNVEYTKLKEDYAALLKKHESETANFQQTISKLETLHDGIQAKLQEDMSYIETLEIENNRFKERIQKLEGCVATFEERRASLERRANVLDAQLQRKTDEYEKNEDVLVYRINMLSEHDDIIGRKLLEEQEEKEELIVKLERVSNEHSDLTQKFVKLEKEYESFRSEKLFNTETENENLRERVKKLENANNKMESQYEEKIANLQKEIDVMENDLSLQLKKVNDEKRELQGNLERSRDEIQELKDENVRLKENVNSLEQIKNDFEREITWIRMQNENLNQDQMELQDLRMQSLQDKTEIENLKHQLDLLIQNHENELNALRTQISELDSLRMQVGQNQTDDQVFIETENKRLKDALSEKEAIIENYQRQNLQLQMSAAFSATSPSTDTFLSIEPQVEKSAISPSEAGTSNSELNNLRNKCEKLEKENHDLQLEFIRLSEQNNNLMMELTTIQQEFARNNADIRAIRGGANNQNTLASAFAMHTGASTSSNSILNPQGVGVLDSLTSANNLQIEGDEQEQKKIEDLQRNVSDLEKYATELENKLRHLTSIYEDTLLQLQNKTREFEELGKDSSNKIIDLNEKLKLAKEESKKSSEHKSEGSKPAQPSLDMFFNSSVQPEPSPFDVLLKREEPNPIVEEMIVPKKMYICTDDTNEEQSEGWGFGSEEIALEEKQFESNYSGNVTLLPPHQSLEIKLQENQDRIKELELERNRLEKQKVELQVKSGKLMKKLKEYKQTISDLTSKSGGFRKSSSVESNDLDIAIQDELKSQVSSLEEVVKELKKQLSQHQLEKDKMSKRIEVITSANERLVQMKERQDIELEIHQSKIRKLTQELKNLEDWGDDKEDKEKSEAASSEKVRQSSDRTTQNEQGNIEKENKELQKELEEVKNDKDELQAILEEEKMNVQRMEKQLESLKSQIVSLDMEKDVLNEKVKSSDATVQALNNELGEFRLKNENLQLQLSDYQSTIEQLSHESTTIKVSLDQLKEEHQKKVDENTKLSNELQNWIEKSHCLSNEIEGMQTNTITKNIQESEPFRKLEEESQKLIEQIQYKDAEILHLNNTIEDIRRQDQTESLVQEILVKNAEIGQLRQKVKKLEDEKLELENNLSVQITNDMSQRKENSNTAEKVQELEKSLVNIRAEKENMEKELEVLNNHVLKSLEMEDKMKQVILELDAKNIEINELKKTLEVFKCKENQSAQNQETQEVNNMGEEELKRINASWEKVVEERCAEIAASWRQHLTQKESEYKAEIESLQSTINKLKEQLEKEKEKPRTIKKDGSVEIEDDKEYVDKETYEKMRAALENQEMEIVTLVEQLATRSAEYARLAAQHDPYAQTSTSSSVFNFKAAQKSPQVKQPDDVVPKSELDIALYKLYQRDMKCEELTLELINLLKERDTLQLKLSNSLRLVEDIKKKTGYTESGSESDQLDASNASSPEKSKYQRRQSEPSIEEFFKNNAEFNEKLSQLQSIPTGRNVNLYLKKDNQEETTDISKQRPIENIQEDIANIPSEAMQQFIGEEISNETQSSSTALLNWLWGKIPDTK